MRQSAAPILVIFALGALSYPLVRADKRSNSVNHSTNRALVDQFLAGESLPMEQAPWYDASYGIVDPVLLDVWRHKGVITEEEARIIQEESAVFVRRVPKPVEKVE